MTEQRAAETQLQPAPAPCGTCQNPIMLTETGWTHLASYGVPEAGWLCPMPHMHLAGPHPPPRRPTPIPPLARHTELHTLGPLSLQPGGGYGMAESDHPNPEEIARGS